jgi:protein-S-isoprenylcysteine O-methyltransferase Ste14
VFYLRLILAEEQFLTEQIGEPYRTYRRQVPRLIPQLRSHVPEAHHQPHWATGVLTELMPIGVFLTLSVLSWRYNHWLLLRGILISFGISLVVRALLPARAASAPPAS